METIGVRELRNNLGRILKRVEQGEIIRVLRHGKDAVELRPIQKDNEKDLLLRLKSKNLLAGGKGIIGKIKSIKPETRTARLRLHP